MCIRDSSWKHILSIGEKVKRVLADSETCPVAENEVSPQEPAPPGDGGSDAGPLIQFEDKAAPLGSTVTGLERNPFVSEANTYPSRLPTSCCYSKLPHPAEKIVRGLPKACLLYTSHKQRQKPGLRNRKAPFQSHSYFKKL